jgi:hypothetical protein
MKKTIWIPRDQKTRGALCPAASFFSTIIVSREQSKIDCVKTNVQHYLFVWCNTLFSWKAACCPFQPFRIQYRTHVIEKGLRWQRRVFLYASCNADTMLTEHSTSYHIPPCFIIMQVRLRLVILPSDSLHSSSGSLTYGWERWCTDGVVVEARYFHSRSMNLS